MCSVVYSQHAKCVLVSQGANNIATLVCAVSLLAPLRIDCNSDPMSCGTAHDIVTGYFRIRDELLVVVMWLHIHMHTMVETVRSVILLQSNQRKKKGSHFFNCSLKYAIHGLCSNATIRCTQEGGVTHLIDQTQRA